MKKISVILSVLLLVVMAAIPAFAVDLTEKPGSYNKFGTKAYGMGGAFTAIADDATAIYWNPAGLTQSSFVGMQASLGSRVNPDDIEAVVDFIDKAGDYSNNVSNGSGEFSEAQNLINDMPDDVSLNLNGMAAVNLKNFAVGMVGNDNLSFDKGTKTLDNNEKLPIGKAKNDLVTQGLVGFGTKVFNPPVVGSLSIGGTGKYISQRTDSANFEPYYNDTNDYGYTVTTPEAETDQGFGADIGALATLTDLEAVNVKAGATVKNLFTTLDSDAPSLKRTITLGTGATFKFPLIEIFSARVAGDLEIVEDNDNIKRLGAEGTLGLFSLRTGIYGSDFGDEDKRTITGGIGFNLPFVDFNLAVDSDQYVNFSGTFNF